MMVALPELDGAHQPMVFGGRCGRSSRLPCAGCDGVSCSATWSRIPNARPCSRRGWRGWSRCAGRRGPSGGSRLVLFNFPPNAGATGTAAYLAVFASLHNTLHAMKPRRLQRRRAGRRRSAARAADRGQCERFGTDANVAARIPVDDHVRRERWLGEIEARLGSGAGPAADATARSIFVLGAQFGNVFVGLQPAFGYEGDPMRLLFESGFAPDPRLRRLLSLDARGFRAPMPCCISARMARSSSCRASRPACPATAGRTG